MKKWSSQLSCPYFSRSIPSPSAQDPLPSPPRATEKYPQNSIDNPNYEHFPSPPPELIQDPFETKDSSRRHFRPVEPVVSGPTKSPPAQNSNQRLRKSVTPPRKEESSTPSSSVGTKTLDRPSSAKKTEVARIAPTMVSCSWLNIVIIWQIFSGHGNYIMVVLEHKLVLTCFRVTFTAGTPCFYHK